MTADDDPADARAAVERTDQAVAALRVRAKAAGFTLCIISAPNGATEYVVGRWGRSRAFADPQALETFLHQVGGTP